MELSNNEESKEIIQEMERTERLSNKKIGCEPCLTRLTLERMNSEHRKR